MAYKKAKIKEESVNENIEAAENIEEVETNENPEVSEEKEAQEDIDNEDSDEVNLEESEKTSSKKDKKDLMIEELTDKYKRTFAEFDNFRKRSEKEKAAMFEVGAKAIIEKILPVVDNFERGLATVPDEEKESPFIDGMNMIYKQLMTSLEEVGVKPIEALGCQFDLELHNAVMHVEDESVDENTIVEEFQKGYVYRDSVVRHSMVKVAN